MRLTLIMSNPESELNLEKLFLPAWAKDSPNANKYAKHAGEDRPQRDERRGGGSRRRRRDFGGRGGQSAVDRKIVAQVEIVLDNLARKTSAARWWWWRKSFAAMNHEISAAGTVAGNLRHAFARRKRCRISRPPNQNDGTRLSAF